MLAERSCDRRSFTSVLLKYMISLQKLIMVAPFSEDVKNELLQKVDTFDKEKEFTLINMCWDLISEWYHNEVDARYRQAMLEGAQEEGKYTKEYFDKIPDTVFNELMDKLKEAGSVEELQEVREKLTQLGGKAHE